jgi:hypothetical protein
MTPPDYRGVAVMCKGSWERFTMVMVCGPGLVTAGGIWLHWRNAAHPVMAILLGLLCGGLLGLLLGLLKRNRANAVVVTQHVVTGPSRGSRSAVTIPLDNVDMVRTRDWSGALLAPLRIASHTGRTIHVSGLLYTLRDRRAVLEALELDAKTRKYPPQLQTEQEASTPEEDLD